jgi:hypothetical protein
MEAVLAAERSAMDAIATSQQRAEEVLQEARLRARRIADQAHRRIAALERANADQGARSRRGAEASQDGLKPTAAEQARLEQALERLADQLLGDGNGVA